MHNYLRLLQLRRMRAADGAGGKKPPETDPKDQDGDAGGDDDGGEDEEDTDEEDDEDDGEPESYSKEDIEKAVARTIARERRKSEKAIEEAAKEAARLATLSAEERVKEEERKRLKGIEEREAALRAGEFRVTGAAEMATRGLPAALADILPYIDAKYHDDEEAQEALISALEKAHRSGVKAGLDAARRPKDGLPKDNKGGSGGSGKNPFDPKTRDLDEQAKLFKDDPEKARALAKAAGVMTF